jgi:hypothetical protein
VDINASLNPSATHVPTVNAHFKLNNHILKSKNNENTIYLTQSNPLAFIVVQLYAMNEQRSIETYPYVVNKK